MSIPDFGPAHYSPSPGMNGRRLRSNTPLNLSLDADDTNSYLYVLQSASEECVRGLFSLQKVAPTIALTSVFAEDVHTLLYTVGNVEVALHQFVDRELVGAESLHRRREQGATLQDAIGNVGSHLKSAVQGSLLAGGIASLLHLFALCLRRINEQLETLLALEEQGEAYAEIAATAACSAFLVRSSARRGHVIKALRAAASVVGTGCAARALLLRLRRRRAAATLHKSSVRLALILQLWWLATSVPQRAHKHRSSSYIELDRLAYGSRQQSGASENGGAGAHSPPHHIGGSSWRRRRGPPLSQQQPQLVEWRGGGASPPRRTSRSVGVGRPR